MTYPGFPRFEVCSETAKPDSTGFVVEPGVNGRGPVIVCATCLRDEYATAYPNYGHQCDMCSGPFTGGSDPVIAAADECCTVLLLLCDLCRALYFPHAPTPPADQTRAALLLRWALSR